MNRRDFFRKLGIGAIAVAVAPKILAEVRPEPVNLSTAIINMRPDLTPLDIIIDHKNRGWCSEQELLAQLRLREEMERQIMFGLRDHIETTWKQNGILCYTE